MSGRPLRYLSAPLEVGTPFEIDNHPLRIIDPAEFNEESDQRELTGAAGIATTLWHWHPYALRAWMDLDRYRCVAWYRMTTPPDLRQNVVIERRRREVTVSLPEPRLRSSGQ